MYFCSFLVIAQFQLQFPIAACTLASCKAATKSVAEGKQSVVGTHSCVHTQTALCPAPCADSLSLSKLIGDELFENYFDVTTSESSASTSSTEFNRARLSYEDLEANCKYCTIHGYCTIID